MSHFRQAREEQRKQSYKYTEDVGAKQKKKREQILNSIRKEKRTQQLKKRRGRAEDLTPPLLEMLPKFAIDIRSSDPVLQLEAITGIRKLLSIEHQPPINEVISIPNIIPDLVTLLLHSTDTKVQFEAAWGLTNVASGSSEQTAVLLKHNAVQAFINKIAGPADASVKEQSIWALGNIAGDSAGCRDFLLHLNILPHLLALTDVSVRTPLRRNAVWCISNLCRGKPIAPFDIVKTAVPRLIELLHTPDDPTIVSDACWALSYLTDSEDYQIDYVLKYNAAPIVAQLLLSSENIVQTPALRVVGNIVTGEDNHTDAIIAAGGLKNLKELLMYHNKKGVKREVCWTISNITAGTVDQIQKVMDEDLIRYILEELDSGEYETRKEAAWAIANATSSGSDEQVKYLVQGGCIESLCELLDSPDSKIVSVCLEGLDNILDRGESIKHSYPDRRNPYALKIEEISGLDKIEKLTESKDSNLYAKAAVFVRKYNKYVDLEDSMAPNPSVNDYQFGSGSMDSEYSF